ncbi:MAG: DUF1848 domain-containing protein [Rhodospirillaceae bacterium]
MIVSASYRTDIPAFYGSWFLERLRAGWCRTLNPYGGPPVLVDLRPESVDGFVFWTRNLEPFSAGLEAVEAAGIPFVVQYTITGYPRQLERSVIDPARAVTQFRRIRARWGLRGAVWRYDPIIFSSLTPPEWHLTNFHELAASLSGCCDEVVVSFMQPYRKTVRNLDAAAIAHNFTWRDPDCDERLELITRLGGIAAEHGMTLTLCTQPDLNGPSAACIDVVRLSDVAGRPLKARLKGNRPGCACAESRDIGAYDTCAHGCVYCYAVTSRATVQKHLLGHDAAAEFLVGG